MQTTSPRKSGYPIGRDKQVAIKTIKWNCVSYSGIKSEGQKFYNKRPYRQEVEPLQEAA
jgi:hypothetical protein